MEAGVFERHQTSEPDGDRTVVSSLGLAGSVVFQHLSYLAIAAGSCRVRLSEIAAIAPGAIAECEIVHVSEYVCAMGLAAENSSAASFL